jgi:hypothetical protein
MGLGSAMEFGTKIRPKLVLTYRHALEIRTTRPGSRKDIKSKPDATASRSSSSRTPTPMVNDPVSVHSHPLSFAAFLAASPSSSNQPTSFLGALRSAPRNSRLDADWSGSGHNRHSELSHHPWRSRFVTPPSVYWRMDCEQPKSLPLSVKPVEKL